MINLEQFKRCEALEINEKIYALLEFDLRCFAYFNLLLRFILKQSFYEDKITLYFGIFNNSIKRAYQFDMIDRIYEQANLIEYI